MTEQNFLKRVDNKRQRMFHALALKRMAGIVARRARPRRGAAPVVLFHASTRIGNFNLNAAFSLLTEWSLRLQGVPVVRFACHRGMTRCVLGSDRDDHTRLPNCAACLKASRAEFRHSDVRWFTWHEDRALAQAVAGLSVAELMAFTWEGLPLGELTLPALRWMLRRHNLQDDEPTRFFYREFIRSAWNVAQRFAALLDEVQPQVVVVFNGQFYPEATAKYLARQRGIRTVTHEVGLRPLSAFFTTGEATAIPLKIPHDFELDDRQNTILDSYLSKRFQGDFSMAGVQFWPEMKRLDADFLQKLKNFQQLVPIFTNVIFDTSQIHANIIFRDMFHWLDTVLEIIKKHPETLFVLRAHPDENRPGKESRESVSMWATQHGIDKLPNVIFVSPDEYISSYDLVQHSKFVVVYNSTIGLESAIMGAAVLSGGKSRFTPYDTVFLPQSIDEFIAYMNKFLRADVLLAPKEHMINARRFLYWHIFKASLPFDEFIRPAPGRYEVHLRFFPPESLLPENSPTMQALADGILRGGDFMYPEP